MTAYTYVWEFQVLPEAHAQFLSEYGPDGSWVRLFKSAPGTIETLLLRDMAASLRHVSVGRWESAPAHQTFRLAHARAYEEIDRRCETLTSSETLIGEFSEGP